MSPLAPDAAIAALASEVGDARVVVGIPSFNNAHSIGHVAATSVRARVTISFTSRMSRGTW